jgi:two-component system response regulator YesN
MSKVLIVDDDREARETLAALLHIELPDRETLLAANGEIGVELTLVHLPMAVVLDVEMPVCDGLQAADRIRAVLGRSAPLLIGVSGNVYKLQHGLDEGLFDHALTKPVLISELLDLLAIAPDAV